MEDAWHRVGASSEMLANLKEVAAVEEPGIFIWKAVKETRGFQGISIGML